MKANFYTESILYSLARAVSALAKRLHPRVNAAIGAAAGTLLYALLTARKRVALDNLRAAFEDRCTPRQYRRILKEMFQNFGRTFMEIAAIPRIDRAYIDRWVPPSPGSREHMESALAKGKGVILITGHFGNWELSSISGALYGYPTLVLAREQGWPKLNQLLIRYRESKGCKVVTKGFAVRELVQGLKEKKIIGILSDQDAGKRGTLAPFFGRLASTASGAVELGIRTGAPVVPIFIVRKSGPVHELVAEEPLVIPEQGTEEERIKAGVAAYLQVLERRIRRNPAQWLWLHRRWKSTPQRRILIFSDGKAGHAAQSRALAEKMQAAWERKIADDPRLKGIPRPLAGVRTAEIRFRNRFTRFLLTLAATAAPRKFSGGDIWLRLCLAPESYRRICSAHADISISCGAGMAAVNLLWARTIRARAVHITRVRFPSWRRFDLVVTPRHDWQGTIPSRVLVTDGALVPDQAVGPDQLQTWKRQLNLSGGPAIGLFIGGPAAKGKRWDPEEMRGVVQSILAAADAADADVLVTTSRRTPPELEERLIQWLGTHPRCKLLTLVNRSQTGGLKTTSEAVPCILGLAGRLAVSGDSISMVSEALATGKPVVAFSPPPGTKYERFLNQLRMEGKLRVSAGTGVGLLLSEPANGSLSSAPAEGPDLLTESLQQWL